MITLISFRFQDHLIQAHELEMTEEDINNMYIRNMNEARRMELELKSGESEAINESQEDYNDDQYCMEDEVL